MTWITKLNMVAQWTERPLRGGGGRWLLMNWVRTDNLKQKVGASSNQMKSGDVHMK